MKFSHSTTEQVNTGGTDRFSAWVQGRGWRRLEYGFKWGAFGGRGCVLHLQGSPSHDLGTIDDWLIDDIPVTVGMYGAWPTIAAVADRSVVIIDNPMSWHRIWLENSGGDTGDFVDIIANLTR